MLHEKMSEMAAERGSGKPRDLLPKSLSMGLVWGLALQGWFPLSS